VAGDPWSIEEGLWRSWLLEAVVLGAVRWA
jgi:hypothetical protein